MARTRGSALSLPLATLSRTTSSTAAYGSRATHTAAIKLLATRRRLFAYRVFTVPLLTFTVPLCFFT